MSSVQQNCQIIELLIEKTWEQGFVVLVVRTKINGRTFSLITRGRNR